MDHTFFRSSWMVRGITVRAVVNWILSSASARSFGIAHKIKILQGFTRADGQVNVANQTQQPCEQKHGIEASSSGQRVHGVRTPLKLSKHAQGANQKVDLCLAVALLSLICDMPENVSWVVCSFQIVSSPNTKKLLYFV